MGPFSCKSENVWQLRLHAAKRELRKKKSRQTRGPDGACVAAPLVCRALGWAKLILQSREEQADEAHSGQDKSRWLGNGIELYVVEERQIRVGMNCRPQFDRKRLTYEGIAGIRRVREIVDVTKPPTGTESELLSSAITVLPASRITW